MMGPSKAISMPARVRSGSVGIADFMAPQQRPPPPPLISGDSRNLPSALNASSGSVRSLRSSGQTSSTRGVRFHPLTPGGTSGNDQEQQGEENDGEVDGNSQIDPNAHVTFRERLGGYLHPRDMRLV